ncbi:hypothetical protein [Streptomyces sp. S.PNR 29]|uniref:hypothetical protein n=1 Tax=Streptomyces sp. S.PNR 29 TaxID=2973805 RepID=UPI0025B179EE|nr:hypothetical protein [Streptomyces sp. S.PNR 29]MDN0196918.1 hypothetical protein [Streptomyces sp. S.PNR 29]
MRKYQRAMFIMAMLGSTGFLGAGVSHAGGDGFGFGLESSQVQRCSANEVNISGSETGAVFAPVNTDGTQLIDQSDVNAANCAQIVGFGR